MGPTGTLDAIYTSAPILDYDEDTPEPVQQGEDVFDAPGVATLAPEAFDAALLAALIAP